MISLNRRAAAGAIGAGLLGAGRASAARFDPGPAVTEAARVVREEYVDPAMATRLADALLAKLVAGGYRVADPAALAKVLTADLRGPSHDLHFSVGWEPPHGTGQTEAALGEDDLHPRFFDWGLQTAARLPGDVGLIRITHFPGPAKRLEEHYAAAMSLMKDTQALVLDLTLNHGGAEDTAALLVSYFFDGEVELGRIKWRKQPVQIVSTFKEVTGPRYGQSRPVYVAVSGETFSAGEAVAQQLKGLKRAVVVGRRTKGGAHPGDFFKLPGDLRMFVSQGRVEAQDWEGVGVPPDVEAAPAQAVRKAWRLAVEGVMARAADDKTRQVLANVLAGRAENLSSFAM